MTASPSSLPQVSFGDPAALYSDARYWLASSDACVSHVASLGCLVPARPCPCARPSVLLGILRRPSVRLSPTHSSPSWLDCQVHLNQRRGRAGTSWESKTTQQQREENQSRFEEDDVFGLWRSAPKNFVWAGLPEVEGRGTS